MGINESVNKFIKKWYPGLESKGEGDKEINEKAEGVEEDKREMHPLVADVLKEHKVIAGIEKDIQLYQDFINAAASSATGNSAKQEYLRAEYAAIHKGSAMQLDPEILESDIIVFQRQIGEQSPQLIKKLQAVLAEVPNLTSKDKKVLNLEIQKVKAWLEAYLERLQDLRHGLEESIASAQESRWQPDAGTGLGIEDIEKMVVELNAQIAKIEEDLRDV